MKSLATIPVTESNARPAEKSSVAASNPIRSIQKVDPFCLETFTILLVHSRLSLVYANDMQMCNFKTCYQKYKLIGCTFLLTLSFSVFLVGDVSLDLVDLVTLHISLTFRCFRFTSSWTELYGGLCTSDLSEIKKIFDSLSHADFCSAPSLPSI